MSFKKKSRKKKINQPYIQVAIEFWIQQLHQYNGIFKIMKYEFLQILKFQILQFNQLKK